MTCKTDLDITPWLSWFCSNLRSAVELSAGNIFYNRLQAAFWKKNPPASLSPAQKQVMDRMLATRTSGLTPRDLPGLLAPDQTITPGEIAALAEKGLLREKEGILEIGDDDILSFLGDIS